MKYALVTGSTRGIGKAIADKFTESGYTVFRNGRSELPGDARYFRADLSTHDGVNALADAMLSREEKLDYLVLNAGATCRKTFKEIEYSDWQDVMDMNLNMPFFLVQRLFEHIADDGSVIFISSSLSFKPHATSIPYGVSKAAVNMLAQCLVKEFAEKRIRVNAVCPGFIDTEWQRGKPSGLRSKIESKTALARFGTPEEIADICLSLCVNTYINGAVVSVDGGYDMI